VKDPTTRIGTGVRRPRVVVEYFHQDKWQTVEVKLSAQEFFKLESGERFISKESFSKIDKSKSGLLWKIWTFSKWFNRLGKETHMS